MSRIISIDMEAQGHSDDDRSFDRDALRATGFRMLCSFVKRQVPVVNKPKPWPIVVLRISCARNREVLGSVSSGDILSNGPDR
jgi:hypothetical protein